MVKNVKISPLQLGILMTAFLLGDAIIVSPAKGAHQDSWIAVLIAWAASYFLIGVYVYISKLYPNKTLIEILQEAFGKILGTIVGIIYIWYFIHLAALIYRSFGEYMVTVNYTETPRVFINIVLMLVSVYALKSGLEVMGRTGEISFAVVPLTVIFLSSMLLKFVDVEKLQPVLEHGIGPVLKTSFTVLTFPFGEAIALMMIFPFLNVQKKIVKTSFISLTLAGFFLFSITLRNMMILGPDMVARSLFPSHTVTTLLEGEVLDPFLSLAF